jgi:hypothetical protein
MDRASETNAVVDRQKNHERTDKQTDGQCVGNQYDGGASTGHEWTATRRDRQMHGRTNQLTTCSC